MRTFLKFVPLVQLSIDSTASPSQIIARLKTRIHPAGTFFISSTFAPMGQLRGRWRGNRFSVFRVSGNSWSTIARGSVTKEGSITKIRLAFYTPGTYLTLGGLAIMEYIFRNGGIQPLLVIALVALALHALGIYLFQKERGKLERDLRAIIQER
jgi:hypothetical protein